MLYVIKSNQYKSDLLLLNDIVHMALGQNSKVSNFSLESTKWRIEENFKQEYLICLDSS